MRILVLDGNENQAVAATRSLARAGHTIVVGAHTRWSKAGWSRGATTSFMYPAPQDDADEFVRQIVAETRQGTLVLPMTERTTLPLSAVRERIFAAGGTMVLPPHEVVLRAFDKSATTKIAAQAGVAVPRTWQLDLRLPEASQTQDSSKQNPIEQLAVTLPFPVVLKPRSSEEIAASGEVVATGAPVYARDAAEFRQACQDLQRRASDVLVQEFIEGTGAGYFALMNNGKLRLEFAHRRVRDVRPTGSGSAVRVSVEPDARVRAASLKILEQLNWHGVAMVEFRVRQDGTPIFLEVNGRFWNSLPLAIYAGADFPRLVAEIAEHGDTLSAREVSKSQAYRVGVRCRWFLGDARHLLAVWQGAPAGYTGMFPSRIQTLADFLTPVRGTFHDNFMLADPLPEVGDWLDFLLRRVPLAALRGKRKRTRSTTASVPAQLRQTPVHTIEDTNV